MKFFLLAMAILVQAGSAFANGIVQSLQGEARAGGQALTANQQVTSGSTITTGPGAQLVLRFQDGQRVVLNENTELRITDYQFNESQPANDRSVFDIARGAARFVSGLLGQRSRNAFLLRSPQATIGIRGTDFMVAIPESTRVSSGPLNVAAAGTTVRDAGNVFAEALSEPARLAQLPLNPMFFQVTTGSIGVGTSAGTVGFGAGSIGSVSVGGLAASISAASLPAGVAGSFSSMGSAAVGAGAGAGAGAGSGAGGAASGAGAGAGAGAAGAGAGLGTVGAIGAAAAAAAAAAGSSGDTSTSHSTTTHH